MGTIGYYYSNVALPDALANIGGIGPADTSISAVSGAPSGYPGQFPFKLRLDPRTPLEEVVKVTAGNGTAASPWTIVRGWDGTLAQTHSEGAAIEHGMTAEDLFLSREHEASDSATPDPTQPADSFPHGLPAGAWLAASFAVISEQLMTASAAQINFTAIPQSYKHLLLSLNGRLTGTAAQPGYARGNVNGDGAARYGYAAFGVNSLSAPDPDAQHLNTSWSKFFDVPSSATGLASAGGGGFALFLDYASNFFSKTVFVLTGFMYAATTGEYTSQVRTCSYNPPSQSGITSITLSPSTGSFKAGTTATLFGIG